MRMTIVVVALMSRGTLLELQVRTASCSHNSHSSHRGHGTLLVLQVRWARCGHADSSHSSRRSRGTLLDSQVSGSRCTTNSSHRSHGAMAPHWNYLRAEQAWVRGAQQARVRGAEG